MKPVKTLLAIGMAAACTMAIGQDASDYQTPRTEWGQPDLQGVWNFSSDTPMAIPA